MNWEETDLTQKSSSFKINIKHKQMKIKNWCLVRTKTSEKITHSEKMVKLSKIFHHRKKTKIKPFQDNS